MIAAQGGESNLSEAAVAVMQLRSSYRDLETPLQDSVAGRLLARLGTHEDVPYCAQVDISTTVPILRPGMPLVVERYLSPS